MCAVHFAPNMRLLQRGPNAAQSVLCERMEDVGFVVLRRYSGTSKALCVRRLCVFPLESLTCLCALWLTLCAVL